MTLKELQTAVDGVVAVLMPDLIQYQASYKNGKATYWQGQELCSTIPEDGAVGVLDRKAQTVKGKPTWDDSGLTAKLMGIGCSVRCDEYVTPKSGAGFTLTATFIWLKDTYTRTWNSGPDATFEQGWVKVVPLGGKVVKGG